MPSISIEPLTVADLPEMLELGEKMRAESAVDFPPLERERIEEFLHIAADMPHLCLAIKAVSNERIVGFLTATMGVHSFCSKLAAIHDCWYVDPAYRGTFTAKRLVQEYEQWAFSNGAYRAVLAIHTGLNIDRMDKFIKLMGYSHMGGIYYKNVCFSRDFDRNRIGSERGIGSGRALQEQAQDTRAPSNEARG